MSPAAPGEDILWQSGCVWVRKDSSSVSPPQVSPAPPQEHLQLLPQPPCPILDKAAGSVPAWRPPPCPRWFPWILGWLGLCAPPVPKDSQREETSKGTWQPALPPAQHRAAAAGAQLLNMHNLTDHTVALSWPLIKRQLLPHPGEKGCWKTLEFPCVMAD